MANLTKAQKTVVYEALHQLADWEYLGRHNDLTVSVRQADGSVNEGFADLLTSDLKRAREALRSLID